MLLGGVGTIPEYTVFKSKQELIIPHNKNAR